MDGPQEPLPSSLDDDALAELRARVAAEAGPFVDPVLLARSTRVLAGVDHDWLTRVLGYPAPSSVRRIGWPDLALAVRAADLDAEHLASAAEHRSAEARRQTELEKAEALAAAERRQAEWRALQDRIPVRTEVRHNWTARHYDPYVQGADHIVVLEPLRLPRWHREPGQPLCWTPGRSGQLQHVISTGDENGLLPNCKRCLRSAERIAS